MNLEENVKVKLNYQPENLIITIEGEGMNLYEFAKKLYDMAEVDSIRETISNNYRYIEFTQNFNL